MKRILTMLIFVLLLPGVGWATANPAGTYYVNQAGSGTGDGSSVDNARSVANHNSDTWAGPSTIYLLDTITSTLTLPSSGADATHIITYRGDYAGHACTFDTGAATGINTNNKNFITINTITFINQSTNQITLGTGTNQTITNCTFSGGTQISIRGNPGANCIISYNNFTNSGANSYPFQNIGASTNLIIDHNTVNAHDGANPNYGFYFISGTELTFTNNTITGFLCEYYIVYINACATVVSSGNTLTNCGGYGYYVKTPSTSFSSTNDTITGQNYVGIYVVAASTNVSFTGTNVNNCTGASGYGWQLSGAVSLTNCIAHDNSWDGFAINDGGTVTATGCSSYNNGKTAGVSANAGDGWRTVGSGVLTATSCSAYNNNEDGFCTTGTGTGIFNRCLAYSNGVATSATSGDGFTSHDTNTTNVYNCIAYNNRKSGVAITGTGNSNIYNNSFYNNYAVEKAGTGGGIVSSKTGGTQNIKNNITANHDLELNIGAVAGVTYTLDNNDYYDSRSGVNAFTYNGTNYANYAAYRAAVPVQDAHSVNVDPVWISVVTPDFHLQASSPKTVYEGGADLSGTFTTDYPGKTRSVPWSMGAYEYNYIGGGGLSPGLGLGGGNFNPRRRQ